MDILEFQINPVTFDFHGAKVTVNADAFTPEFFRNAANRIRKQYDQAIKDDKDQAKKLKAAKGAEALALQFEDSARLMEVERDIYAALLAGSVECPVLLDWDLTRNGEPVPVTETEIGRLKPKMVRELYVRSTEVANPKSQETPETGASRTISETTASGSQGSATIQAPADQSM